MPCSACGSHRQSKGNFQPLTKKKDTKPRPPPPPPVVTKKKIASRNVFRPVNSAQYKLYKERMMVVEAARKKKLYARRFKRMNFSMR